MIEINEAIRRIVASTRPLPEETISLSTACDRVLRQAVISDVDAPPFDKSIMDGFAVRADDITTVGTRLTVVETILAGQLPTREIRRGEAARIMTGAPMPAGADSVVMIENATLSEDPTSVKIEVSGLRPGHHTMKRGSTMQIGQTVLPAGQRIRPHDIGLLAEAGAGSVHVFRRPSMAVLATGDELVTASDKPGPPQIRNSNGPMLAAVGRAWCSEIVDLGIAKDTPESLGEKIAIGLQHDLLVLSGGVSAGLVDFVPRILAEQGTEPVFHQVNIKPGKPIWYGTNDRQNHRCHVFGLPGNPVSTLVCFEQFVTSCLLAMTGNQFEDILPARRSHAILSRDHAVRGGRVTYWPVESTIDREGRQWATPCDWKGSSDLQCLANMNGFAILPPRDGPYPARSVVQILQTSR